MPIIYDYSCHYESMQEGKKLCKCKCVMLVCQYESMQVSNFKVCNISSIQLYKYANI